MAGTEHKSVNTFRDFAKALAQANGHPQPDDYVERAVTFLNNPEHTDVPAVEEQADGNS